MALPQPLRQLVLFVHLSNYPIYLFKVTLLYCHPFHPFEQFPEEEASSDQRRCPMTNHEAREGLIAGEWYKIVVVACDKGMPARLYGRIAVDWIVLRQLLNKALSQPS